MFNEKTEGKQEAVHGIFELNTEYIISAVWGLSIKTMTAKDVV